MKKDDASPEISGARRALNLTGNEPMLKGVYQKVQADQLGAYKAKNLRLLINMMSLQQQFRLQIWCARVAVRKAYEVLPIFEALYPDDKRPREAVEAAESWIANPEIAFTHVGLLESAYMEANDAVEEAHKAHLARQDLASSAAESAAAAALSTVRTAFTAAYDATLRTTELFRGVCESACVAKLDDVLVDWKPTWQTFRVHRRSTRKALLRAAYVILQGER